VRPGEGYIAPLETIGEGVIVFDGSPAGYRLLTSPVYITINAATPSTQATAPGSAARDA
jgi:hypothetical protein